MLYPWFWPTYIHECNIHNYPFTVIYDNSNEGLGKPRVIDQATQQISKVRTIIFHTIYSYVYNVLLFIQCTLIYKMYYNVYSIMYTLTISGSQRTMSTCMWVTPEAGCTAGHQTILQGNKQTTGSSIQGQRYVIRNIITRIPHVFFPERHAYRI